MLVILASAEVVWGFIWHLTDILPANEVLQFSERYMFPSGKGPSVLDQGESFIQIDTDLLCYKSVNRSSTIGYAVYATDEGHHHETLEGICSGLVRTEGTTAERRAQSNEVLLSNDWAMNVVAAQVKTEYVGTVTLHGHKPPLFLNGTYFLYKADARHKYEVTVEAWHNVAFQLCENEEVEPQAHVDGMIQFRNPYGYLPGELYGYLPFEAARALAYFAFMVVYVIQYMRYKESALSLHKGVLFVLSVGLAESATWYAAYATINANGQPYCCPFPPIVVAGFVLQVFRQTFSRLLLLIVCLGYGIVRPRLLPAEWVSITIVATLYFVAAVIGQISEVVLLHDVHPVDPEEVVLYQLPMMVMDVAFLSWIYVALSSTIRILGEYRQTVKLEMFMSLARAIAAFVALFTFVTLLVLADKKGLIAWPWKYTWAQNVSWEVLNLGIIVTVGAICMPSATSNMLSYAHQLPQDDPDDDDEVDDLNDSEMDGDIELADMDGLNSEDEDEDEEDGGAKGRERGGDDYSSLPPSWGSGKSQGSQVKNPLRT